MSLYFRHIHLSPLSDDTYESIFLFQQIGQAGEVRRLSVRLKKDTVVFFYTDIEDDHPIAVNQQGNFLTMPLHSAENINYFLLNPASAAGRLTRKNSSAALYYKSVLPDAAEFLTDEAHPLNASIYELLLCFFDELNNSQSDICRYSPGAAAQTRESLERSSVYQLVKKKFAFFKAYDDTLNGRPHASELRIRYNDYLTLLLDDKSVKEIPIKKTQVGWFQNPQSEITELARINEEQAIDPESMESIKRYFLSKHAILSAVCIKAVRYFRIVVGLQLAAFLCFIVVWVRWLTYHFALDLTLLVAGTVFFGVSVFFLAAMDRKKFFDLLMPRILIALTSALFLSACGEDILKRQMSAEPATLITAIAAGLLILPFFIYSECRQYSPYYALDRYLTQRKLFNWKTLPVLIYIFNVSVILVLFAQLIALRGSTEKNQLLRTRTFALQLNRLDYLQDQYATYIDKLEKTQKECASSLNLNTYQRISYFASASDPANRITLNSIIDITQSKPTATAIYFNYYTKLFKDLKITDSILAKDLADRDHFKQIALWQFMGAIQPPIVTKSNVDTLLHRIAEDINKLTLADSICKEIQADLSAQRAHFDHPENLEALITYRPDAKPATGPDHWYGFEYDRKHVYITKFGGDFNIYPRIFIIQVIVIMLIGLVSQLVMSGKVITQPL